MKTAIIAGGSGLVGGQLLQLLLASDRYEKVTAIVRTELHVTHPKLRQVRVDFTQLERFKESLKADDVYCCLGTTMAKAKSKEKFYQIDYTFPLALAKLTAGLGARQFLLISALGADKHASIYYNRVKGELEDAVAKIKFDSIHIFRPSLLLGPRSESRPAEDAAKIFYKIFGFLLPAQYKAIDSAKVAKAMLYYAAQEQQGFFVHESRQLQQI